MVKILQWESGVEELNTVLDNAIGKHIEFEMRHAGQDRPGEEQYINLTGIHFDIVTENEENMPERESVQESSGADASDEPEYSEEESGGMIVSGAVDDMDVFSADAGFDDENAFEEKDDDSEE